MEIRTKLFWAVVVLAVLFAGLAVVSPWFLLAEIVLVPLVVLGIWDYFQPRHSILRNYPLAGHLRFLIEDMGPSCTSTWSRTTPTAGPSTATPGR